MLPRTRKTTTITFPKPNVIMRVIKMVKLPPAYSGVPPKNEHFFKMVFLDSGDLVIKFCLNEYEFGEFSFFSNGIMQQLNEWLFMKGGISIPENYHPNFMHLANKSKNNLALVDYQGAGHVLFTATPDQYRLLFPHQFPYNLQRKPLFYQDDRRIYFIYSFDRFDKSKFQTFFHPFVHEFIKDLNNKNGISGLLNAENQRKPDDDPNDKDTVFYKKYIPNEQQVDLPYPREDVDFEYSGAYSEYNWELFFHIPLLIATRLSKNQRFEEARDWFHYIFNPTISGTEEASPARYWNLKKFKTTDKQRLDEMLISFSKPNQNPDENIANQLRQIIDNPFEPHRIARLRLVAYQKNVVMKYLDNLIAWGDQLFRQDTIETINEATQLYILAANILGPRPQRIPRRGTINRQTFALLRDNIQQSNGISPSNPLVDENLIFPFSSNLVAGSSGSGGTGLPGMGRTLFFCVPQNDKLLGYWDTVADRLFKIRHCMNIEGVVRELPLFEPPIDPALLVQAAAKGIDLGSVLNDLSAPMSCYRFSYLLQKALELCAELKSLAGALLSALEKKDAEKLSAIRASHETAMLDLVRLVKEQQLKEAKASLDGLDNTRKMVEIRQTFYDDNLKEGRTGLEKEQEEQLNEAQDWQAISQFLEIAASVAFGVPDFEVGVAGLSSPVATVKFGGSSFGHALQAYGKVFSYLSSVHSFWANQASTQAGWERREREWKLQKDTIAEELKQIDKQKTAADLRVKIIEQEIKNHDKQIENAKQIEEFLRDKYTNEELYGWLQGEVSTVYFQCYQLAYDLAKKAEKAFRFERGLTTSNFIQFGYWDSLRKGLLAGERLYLALKQMEHAYLDQNKRDYEITKHVSLVLHDPLALMALKQTGQCEVFLPEALFDADYPGHYMRRIKSASITLPAVVGPYTSVNCTLTLVRNKTRIKSEVGAGYEEDLQNEDPRFVTNFAPLQSIATSHAQNDSGLFELNFRDERYLPFEGAGAISQWRIELPKECNAFDLHTLTDVVLHLKYTAREGGEMLKRAAHKAQQAVLAAVDKAPLARLFSMKNEFPTEWRRFLHPTSATADSQVLQVTLATERFPFQFRGQNIAINKLDLFLKLKDGILEEKAGEPLKVTLSGVQDGVNIVMKGMPHAQPPLLESQTVPVDFKLEATSVDIGNIAKSLFDSVKVGDKTLNRLKADVVEDLVVICHYSVTKPQQQG